MAEQAARHVVNSTQSMGADAPIDVPGNTQSSNFDGGDGRVTSLKEHVVATQSTSPTPASAVHLQSAAPHLPSADPASIRSVVTTEPSISTKDDFTNGARDKHSQDAQNSDSTAVADFDWRRPDNSEPTVTPAPRDRSNSFKKPTSFKAVSVTKNFLAKSIGASPSPKLGSDKGLSTAPAASPTPLMAKPRLVAKTGRDTRSAGIASSAPSGAPDPTKVWNRNRPVAPAPPKQFTDEELKQQYGIHLATRLQADEPATGSKWADMEDDEDDWAPDTVEWMDGTKSSLQPSEEQKALAAAAEARVSTPPAEGDAQPPTPGNDAHHPDTDPGRQQSSLPGPGKTILRPGARVSLSQTKPGLVLRNVPEPATEVPKQPTPGNSKSPWAKLPPVDKISPITFYPPSNPDAKPQTASYRDYDTPPPSGPSPAREIAADTFDRSWRDSERGSRELFDSKSGRYEPVRDKRRPSFRQEGGFRPPSVLQRPSHGRPAEGSDASPRMSFSNDARVWDRRRSSTAVEEDSAPSRKDAASVSPQSGKASVADQPPPSDGSSAVPKTFAAHAPQNPNPPGTAPGSSADVHAMQQQLMRQRIDANRKRKEEEQAREEAERKERIRQRLLALGEAPKRQESSSPEKPQAPPDKPDKPAEERSASAAPSADATLAPRVISPGAMEPAAHLDGLGEVPESMTKKAHSVPAADGAPVRPPGLQSEPLQAHGLGGNNLTPSQSQIGHPQPTKSTSEPADLSSKFLTEPQRGFDRQQPQWGRVNGTLAAAPGWTPGASSAHNKMSTSVWGPPSRDKPLGNGAFETGLPSISFPSQTAPQGNQLAPGPIAPPSSSPNANVQANRSEPSPPSGLSPGRGEWTGPPGYPSRSPFPGPPVQRHQGAFFNQIQPQVAVGAHWNSIQRNAAEEERRQTPSEAAPSQPFNNPPKKGLPGEPLGDRWMAERQRAMHGTPGSENLTPAMTPPMLGHSMAPGVPLGGAPRTSSRFFGTGTERSTHANVPGVIGQMPPPETSDSQTGGTDSHLFEQDVRAESPQPMVRLPRPRPKVRLPTTQSPRPAEMARMGGPPSPLAGRSMETGPASPGLTQYRQHGMRFGQQPIVAQAEWQNRFDLVTGRKPTGSAAPPTPTRPTAGQVSMPPKPQPVGVSTSTRPPMDIAALSRGATVSLPQKVKAKDPRLYSLPAHMAEARPDEGCLWEEPETGSTPTIKLPAMLPKLGWSVAGVGKRMNAAKPASVQAGLEAGLPFETSSRVVLHLPGKTTKWIPLRHKTTSSPAPPARGAIRKPFKKPLDRGESSSSPARDTAEQQRRTARPPRKSGESAAAAAAAAGPGLSVPEGAPGQANKEKRTSWAKPPRGNKAPRQVGAQT